MNQVKISYIYYHNKKAFARILQKLLIKAYAALRCTLSKLSNLLRNLLVKSGLLCSLSRGILSLGS